MSTLGGILNFDGKPVDDRVLSTLSNALASNGPDSCGQYLNGSIGVVSGRSAQTEVPPETLGWKTGCQTFTTLNLCESLSHEALAALEAV